MPRNPDREAVLKWTEEDLDPMEDIRRATEIILSRAGPKPAADFDRSMARRMLSVLLDILTEDDPVEVAADIPIAPLPRHDYGLTITHNEQRCCYTCVAEWVRGEGADYDWPSPEAKARAIEADEIWTMVWYPVSGVGSQSIAAPTAAELLEFAGEIDRGAP
jgi:hypothetical protein